MEYLLSSDHIRIVAAADRRNWKRRSTHPLETQIRTAAGTHVPVLISAARSRARAIAGQIHRRSANAEHPLILVDCTLAPEQYEPQLFQTDVGTAATLLLIDVEHLPRPFQLRLRARLTVEARVRTMGAAASLLGIRRLLATSSGDLYDAVERGLFDRDLFYRLNTFHIVPNGL
jgi:DNA-binding NtrC family response regulator